MIDPGRLDAVAERAWPPEELLDLDGWHLRAMQGVTRRGNSVLPHACRGSLSLSQRIDRAERFYDARGLPRLFHVGPAAAPLQLDAELDRRGYVIDAPVSLRTASVVRVLRETRTWEDVELCVDSEPSPALFCVLGERGRYRDALPVFRSLLERLSGRILYAVACVRHEPVGAGFAVVEPPWAGIFSMRTEAAWRGRGIGRSLLHALAEAVLDRQVTQAYLQVERDNAAALALYSRAGFAEQYGYHYRLHPGVSGGGASSRR